MKYSVDILVDELHTALKVGGNEEVVKDLRSSIMILNKNMFHQKIMGSDPFNQYYNG